MFSKKNVTYFGILFLPVFIVSILIDVVFSLQVREHIEIDWCIVILLAVILDVLIIWRDNSSKQKEGDSK